MKQLASRVSEIDTTIFATMSDLALRTGSINLGQGFPDTDGPDEVREAAVAALRGGRHQYAPAAGAPGARPGPAPRRPWRGARGGRRRAAGRPQPVRTRRRGARAPPGRRRAPAPLVRDAGR